MKLVHPWNPDENSDLTAIRQLIEKRKWEEASALCEAYLKVDPFSVKAWMFMTDALVQLNRREEALRLLDSAIPKSRGSIRRALLQRGKVVSRSFLSNKTFQLYQDGVNFLTTARYHSAKEKFEKALAEEPDNLEILIRLGQSAVYDQDVNSAIARLKSAKKLYPFEAEARLWLGRAYYLKGMLSQAITELKSVQSELPDSELAPVWLAEAWAASGQSNVGAALRLLEKDTKDKPFHIQSLIAMARIRSFGGHADARLLWSSRRDLQLALSRLEVYKERNPALTEGDFGVPFYPSVEEINSEIQRLLVAVQKRIDLQPTTL